MATDIKLDCVDGKFKFRVCGIVTANGKYLVVKINNNPFYCLPGGHVEIGETTEEAVIREIQEEVGYSVRVVDILAIMQNFFKSEGTNFHEIAYYYIVEPINFRDVNQNDYHVEEVEKSGFLTKLDFKWVTFEELQKIDFRPEPIINCLKHGKNLYIVRKDN